MNILVTGGAGYIGSHAVRALLAEGHAVTVVDDLSHGYAPAIDRRATLIQCSTAETARITELLQERSIEAVIHFAAFIEVGESVAQPGKYYLNNFANGLSLLEAMRMAGV